MRKNNKQVTTYFILFSLLLIGVVYAILQANLQINGTAKIQANTWDIHFDNIQVNENSVSIGENDSAATIDPDNNCKVDFEVTLSIPGDFYEFTIDVVNAGTIDGMIGTLNKTLKVNNEVVSEVPDFLNYSITYEDGVEIEENHKLEAGVTETYKVRLEFKSDIEELPQATTISTCLEPQFIQADSTSTSIVHTLYYNLSKEAVIDNIKSTYVNNSDGIHFDTISYNKNGQGLYLRYNTENDTYPIYYFRGSITNNNVMFAGFCWKIVRTTETGGVKLIYNGHPENNQCANISGEDAQIQSNGFGGGGSVAASGYMYGMSYPGLYTLPKSYMFGTDYDDINGKLVSTDAINISSSDWGTYYNQLNNHHYTCMNSSGECDQVYYVYHTNSSVFYYITIPRGRKISEVIDEMLSNNTNSSIKNTIDTWYQNNMTSYTSKLEDTVFCNDRTIAEYGGWDPNGGDMSTPLQFGPYYRSSILFTPNLQCSNKKDSFTVMESENGNGLLTYPVGLLTVDEVMLAGGKYNTTNSYCLFSGKDYWLMSPGTYDSENYRGLYVAQFGRVNERINYNNSGVRPVVSLKSGTVVSSGDGTPTNPYIVE